MTVGEVKERKGQLDTLKGIAMLKKEFPHFIYLIIGSARDTQYVQRIKNTAKRLGVGANIYFISSAKNDTDLAALYSIADIHFSKFK